MANQEQVDLLKQSVEDWNQWRENNPEVDINLNNANLSNLNLGHVNLKNADLSFANLENTDLRFADLCASKCISTNFKKTKLQNAILGDFSLLSNKNSWFSNANFQCADISQSIIKGAVFIETSFENANLEKTVFDECSIRSVSFHKANLEEADFSTSSGLLQSVDFSEARLKEADFSGRNHENRRGFNVNLSSCNFKKADLTGIKFAKLTLKKFSNIVIFEDTNLSEIDFSTLDLSGVEFIRCNFINSVFCESDLRYSNFIECNFQQALFWQTKVVSTNFKGSDFTAACIDDWHDNRFTNLEDTICEYIYFKLGEKATFLERRPSDPSRHFACDEFVKLIQKARETVDLIFSEGIDWQAFLNSYQNVQLESDHGELDIRAIEKSPDGSFVIRVAVPEDTNKAELEAQFYERYEGELKRLEGVYQRELQAKDREIEIYRQKSTDMFELAKLAASRPITVEAKAVAGDNIQQSGNFGIGYMGGGEIQSGAKVAGIYNEAEKQDLQTAAREIQALLDQLDKDYGNSKTILATEVIRAVDNNSKLKTLLTSLQAGSMAALEQFLNHPAASFVITFLDTWHQEQLNG